MHVRKCRPQVRRQFLNHCVAPLSGFLLLDDDSPDLPIEADKLAVEFKLAAKIEKAAIGQYRESDKNCIRAIDEKNEAAAIELLRKGASNEALREDGWPALTLAVFYKLYRVIDAHRRTAPQALYRGGRSQDLFDEIGGERRVVAQLVLQPRRLRDPVHRAGNSPDGCIASRRQQAQ